MSLARFTTSDILGLIKHLNLDVDEVNPGSLLYNQLLKRERHDLEQGIDLTAEVQSAIAELTIIEQQLVTMQGNKFYGATELTEDIDGEYSYRVKYRDSSSIDIGLKTRQRYLIDQIKKMIWCPKSDNRICLG